MPNKILTYSDTPIRFLVKRNVATWKTEQLQNAITLTDMDVVDKESWLKGYESGLLMMLNAVESINAKG
jgi:hypothetical protein